MIAKHQKAFLIFSARRRHRIAIFFTDQSEFRFKGSQLGRHLRSRQERVERMNFF